MPTTAAAELVEASADDCGSGLRWSTRALTTTVVDGLANDIDDKLHVIDGELCVNDGELHVIDGELYEND
eukprot:12465127-Heterocapsa_arctica.AAC.1